jgi:uncharacterized OB-fold protein
MAHPALRPCRYCGHLFHPGHASHCPRCGGKSSPSYRDFSPVDYIPAEQVTYGLLAKGCLISFFFALCWFGGTLLATM